MSLNLLQINNANNQGPTVPGEYLACPEATAAAGLPQFVCTFGDQQHFAYSDNKGNIQDCWSGERVLLRAARAVHDPDWHKPLSAPKSTTIMESGAAWRLKQACRPTRLDGPAGPAPPPRGVFQALASLPSLVLVSSACMPCGRSRSSSRTSPVSRAGHVDIFARTPRRR
jgi:hypothetical protein